MISYEYPRPAVTATAVIICPSNGRTTVLTGRRTSKTDAFPGYSCLPGGFVDEGEQVEQAMIREIKEETGLEVPLSKLNLFAVYSDPIIDPRCHVVNVCYLVILVNPPSVRAGDDLSSIAWVSTDPVVNEEIKLAFNHTEIVKDALSFLEEKKRRRI